MELQIALEQSRLLIWMLRLAEELILDIFNIDGLIAGACRPEGCIFDHDIFFLSRVKFSSEFVFVLCINVPRGVR